MEKTEHGWNIVDEDAGVLSYTYTFSKGATANCFTVRLASGGLAVLSPPSRIPEDAVADLEAYGPVEALVPNNGFHHLGMEQWRGLFPKARCFAAEKARTRIGKKSKTAGAVEPLADLMPLLAEGVVVREACSTKCGELWARVKIDGGYGWYTSDILANMPSLPPKFPTKQLFKWTKSAPGYRVFNLAAKFILDDKKAVLREMLEDVKAHPPTIVVPAHGHILADDDIAQATERVLSAALA